MAGRPRGSKNIPWDDIVAKLRKHPGRWLLLPEMRAVSDRTISFIKRRGHRALRLDDGYILVQRKATVWLPDGGVRCTLMLKFERKKGDATQRENEEGVQGSAG